jgi:hypothetical protein
VSHHPRSPFMHLSAFADGGDLHVIIDTPKGSRNKFKYDPELGLFELNPVYRSNFLGHHPSTSRSWALTSAATLVLLVNE